MKDILLQAHVIIISNDNYCNQLNNKEIEYFTEAEKLKEIQNYISKINIRNQTYKPTLKITNVYFYASDSGMTLLDKALWGI